MINEKAFLGSILGAVILFIYVSIYIVVLNKVLKQKGPYYKTYEPEEHGFISSVFNMESILNGIGCWVYSVVYIILFYWMYDFNSMFKYMILTIILLLNFQSLIGYIKNELLYRVNNSTNIILSLISTLIVVLFISLSNIFFSAFLLLILLIIEFLVIHREFTGVWEYIFDRRTYTLEDVLFLYTPTLVIFTVLLIIIL